MIPFSPALKRFGLVLFSLGVLLAFSLTALMVWADVEAVSYGFPRVGNEPMSGLSCPAFMNSAETAGISVTVKNSIERTLRTRVQVYISEPGFARWSGSTKPAETEPGGRNTVTWDVGPDNIVLSYFVLVKAYTFASYPQKDVEGTCGIFVVDFLGLRGDMLYWLWLGVSLAFLFSGIWLRDYWKTDAELTPGKGLARKVLAVLAVLGLIAGSAGWWPVGIITLLLVVIALPAVLFFGQDR